MRTLLTTIIVLMVMANAAFSDNWPQWRGPNGNGVSKETGLPVRWSKNEIIWKAPLKGLGVSSPIIWGDRIFITSQIGRGALRDGSHPTLARGQEAAAEKPMSNKAVAGEDPKQAYFLIEAFHRTDGRRLWEYRITAEGPLPPVHQKHNLASPSPVTDGELIYVWFGTGQLAALSMDGKLVWQRHLGKENSPFEVNWGHASSPSLYRDLLILLCDHTPAAYLLALDKKTGKEKWKVDRGKGLQSHSTPTVVKGPAGDELIINSSERIEAYEPATGKLLWQTGEANRFPIGVPSAEGGVIYTSRGYRSGPYMAIRLGGRGDITRTHVEWLVPTGAPYISSLLHYQGLIYMANDAGIATCVDAKTGERVWQERIEGIFSASPVAGDGKVYLLSETGETIVIEAGRQFRILARNQLDERMVASPAISGGQIFIRTDEHLYCIGKRSAV
jgi:outer membrane protein assembly factor BamB